MGRILALDYGARRTGLAVTDPSRIIAGGLTTVKSAELIPYLAGYFASEEVDLVIIGRPTQMSGAPSPNQANIQRFMKQFARQFPHVPVQSYDERFTSVLAHQTILQSGIGKKARQNKSLVDEISATIILQSYLESLRKQKSAENKI